MQNVFTAYKQIEQILRYVTTIAEQTDEGIVVVDLDSSILFVNEAWTYMHDYKTNDAFKWTYSQYLSECGQGGQ